MKTLEFIRKVNENRRFEAVIVGEYIEIYAYDEYKRQGDYFYKYPIVGESLGVGYSHFENIEGIDMNDLSMLINLLTEYIKTPYTKRKEEVKKYLVWYDDIYSESINVLYKCDKEANSFNKFFCASIDSFLGRVNENYVKNAKLTELEIKQLPEKFIPKQFGGIGFTECVEFID